MLKSRDSLTLAALSFSLIVSFALTGARVSAGDAPQDAAKALYDSKCASCHGKSGDGTGRKGKDLTPRPTDFTDSKVFTDKKKVEMNPEDRMAKAIKEGGLAVGQSDGMNAFPDFTPEQIRDLVAYLKTFQKK